MAALLAVAAIAVTAPPLLAQPVSPFARDSVGISEDDWALLTGAMRGALEEDKVGATRTWRSAKSGRAGKVTVTRVFQRDGMKCAQITHKFTAGPGYSYTAPLCKVQDGSWKLAF